MLPEQVHMGSKIRSTLKSIMSFNFAYFTQTAEVLLTCIHGVSRGIQKASFIAFFKISSNIMVPATG